MGCFRFNASLISVWNISVFDGLVRLCFSRLGEALYSILEPIKQEQRTDVTKEEDNDGIIKNGPLARFRRWKKHNAVVKQYLNDLQSVSLVVRTNKSDVALI